MDSRIEGDVVDLVGVNPAWQATEASLAESATSQPLDRRVLRGALMLWYSLSSSRTTDPRKDGYAPRAFLPHV
jgi:hypothetical protein